MAHCPLLPEGEKLHIIVHSRSRALRIYTMLQWKHEGGLHTRQLLTQKFQEYESNLL